MDDEVSEANVVPVFLACGGMQAVVTALEVSVSVKSLLSMYAHAALYLPCH